MTAPMFVVLFVGLWLASVLGAAAVAHYLAWRDEAQIPRDERQERRCS